MLSHRITKFVLDVVLVGKVRAKVGSHLGMGEETLVFAFDVLAQIGIVGRVMADGLGGIFWLKCFKTKEILHGEFERCFAIATTTAVFIYSYCFLERRHGIKNRVNDNLSASKVGTQDIETTERTADEVLDIGIFGDEIVDFLNRLVHVVIHFEWAPLKFRVVFAEIGDGVGVNGTRETVDVNCFHMME